MPTSPFEEHLRIFSNGRWAVLCDDLLERKRAVIVAPAQDMTSERFNAILNSARSLPFVALSPERSNAFVLHSMARPQVDLAASDRSRASVSQLVSVEAREGISTGISTADRACTIAILGEKNPHPRKLVKPGHIFPVDTRPGGALVKAALPEGALDLVRLAGFSDAALYMDIVGDDGELATAEEAEALATVLGIPFIRLTEVVGHRLRHEHLVHRVAEARLPTKAAGEVRSLLYRTPIHGTEHVALIKGDISGNDPVLVRVQPELTLRDVLGGGPPPSRAQILGCLEAIGARGRGILIYLRRAGGQSLSDELRSISSQAEERPASMMREYGIGAQILRDLGLHRIELMSSSSRIPAGLSMYGIEIVRFVPVPMAALEINVPR